MNRSIRLRVMARSRIRARVRKDVFLMPERNLNGSTEPNVRSYILRRQIELDADR